MLAIQKLNLVLRGRIVGWRFCVAFEQHSLEGGTVLIFEPPEVAPAIADTVHSNNIRRCARVTRNRSPTIRRLCEKAIVTP